MREEDVQAIIAAVAALDEKASLALVHEALEAKVSSVDITRAVEQGMQRVGERYEQQDIFLSGLIMAGEIFRGVMELARPGLEHEMVSDAKGRVLLGTVAGDIHDIGKNLASLAFRSFGFTVKDLGVNVPAQRFLEEAKAFAPDIIGLSGLLSVAFTSMRDTIGLIREHAADLPSLPMMVIGGCTIDEHAAKFIDADFWTTDAMAGVRICQRYMEEGQSDDG
jgi:methanogenic corrinoid protein MtbC1